jgi:hypothetical protein
MEDVFYEVEWLINNRYQVIKSYWDNDLKKNIREVAFQGTISDCESWIRLKEGGYFAS